MSNQLQPTTSSKSHPTNKSKWEHPPPTPLSVAHESCFPKNRTFEGYMKYSDYKTPVTRYYFVLSNNFLLAAEDIESIKLSIVIPVEGKTISIDPNPLHNNSGNKFIIGGKKKTFHFETQSSDLTLKWISVIQKACTLKVHDIYRFAYEIGSGSCGTSVIAAQHRTTRKRVAIKVINKKKIKNRQRLSHEITIMKQLRRQPCIVELYDIYESKKHLYLVMELCEGGDLLTNIANESLYEDITCHVMHQIARAVKYMHNKGIVHRDLKPENILCCKKSSVERIKVADFGISKHIDNINSGPSFNTPVGTLTYTAPELLNGELYGKEVDYWALGVIMHIMLCGYSPWSHCNNEIETRRCIIDQEIELKDRDWTHVSHDVKDLVLRLLHRDPKQRATNDEILKITWQLNKDKTSWRNARTNLKKTIRVDRIRQYSTGTVEASLHLMKRVYATDKYNQNKNKNKIKNKKDKNKLKKKKKKKKSKNRRTNGNTCNTISNIDDNNNNLNDNDNDDDRYLSPPPQKHSKGHSKVHRQHRQYKPLSSHSNVNVNHQANKPSTSNHKSSASTSSISTISTIVSTTSSTPSCSTSTSSTASTISKLSSTSPISPNKSNKMHQLSSIPSTMPATNNPQTSLTTTTDEESDNFPSPNLKKKKKKRKKSNHSSEPLNNKKYQSINNNNNNHSTTTKLSSSTSSSALYGSRNDYAYRRRSRDDSELCNRRLNLAARSIERYIDKMNKKKLKKAQKNQKNNNDNSSDDSDDDQRGAFPHVKLMGYSLFDL